LKTCVFGAGAIGGFIAAALKHAGHPVCAVARGAQLAAIQSRGITVRIGGGEFQVPIDATDNPAEFGVQDIVFVTLKAPALEAALPAIKPLLGAQTAVVFLMNGIPWWYYFKQGDADDGRRLPRLDPRGVIWDTIGPERAIGGVAYCAATVAEPAVIKLDYPDARFEFGEPDGSSSRRLQNVLEMFQSAKLNAAASDNIRERIWAKLSQNMVTGPIAVLSGAILKDAFAHQAVIDAAHAILSEGQAITQSLGMRLAIDREAFLVKMSKSGHKPSILQDFEAGRPMEIDAIYTVPLEIARRHGVKTPTLDLLVDLVKLRATAAGLYENRL
jgi:2-dehydropantoate 2-reductase